MPLESIITVINTNESLITYGYKNRDDLIHIAKKLFNKIDSLLKDTAQDKRRELIKKGVRKALGLHKSDIVFFKNGYLFVKLFDTKKVKKIKEAEKGTIAGRYNGIDEKELESFYKNFCNIKHSDNFYKNAARRFMDTYLIEKKIDNDTYEKYVFQYIQSIINEYLTSTYDKNDLFFKGFSGYIFRIHFLEVFGYIADFMLFEISMSNKYMMDFLNYYSMDIVVSEGRKYKIPEIKAQSGLKWNVVSMLSIVKVYNKAMLSIDSLEAKKEELRKSMSEFLVGDVSPIEYNAIINKELDKVSQSFFYCTKKQETFYDMLQLTADEKKREEIKNDIKDIKNELQELNVQKKTLSDKLITQTGINKYTSLQKDIDAINRQQKRDEKILSQNEEAYISIKNSLVRALISKKQLLS